MKTKLLFKIALFGISLVSIISCTERGFRTEEVKKITSNDKHTIIPLLTVDNKSDSLFLRQESRKVYKANIRSKTMTHLKSRMVATVTDPLNLGVGLAAPQIGIGIQMILVQRFDKPNEPLEFYFNPKITEFSDSINAGFEGCLSVPGYMGSVERSHNINISYRDSAGAKQQEEISGFTAVIFQHEIDHLNGALYFDHVFGGFDALTPSTE